MNRRSFLRSASGVMAQPLLHSLVPASSGLLLAAQQNTTKKAASKSPRAAADHSLTIQPCTIEISPGVNLKTVAYNGQVPGPPLRLPQGVRATLGTGPYPGQLGFLLIDGDGDPGHYDQEVFLAIHHWQPSFVPMVETMQAQSANHPANPGSDVGYQYATMNAHRLGAGEPIRVKQGQRVLMRLLNASATENVLLALPGHTFRVIALDGNPVPNPKEVKVVQVAVAERVDAIVEMKSPGVWTLGSTLEKSRQMGLGIVVEYAGKSGPPVWKDPPSAAWDYTQFAAAKPLADPDETLPLALMDMGPQKDAKFDTWAINGQS